MIERCAGRRPCLATLLEAALLLIRQGRLDMSEQEIKLNVPPAARAGVARQMQRNDARSIHLHSMYFDTPTRQLAQARIALRLRQEGNTWVQTLKTPGADAITRVEINHNRPGPVLDLSVYTGTAVEATLARVQDKLGLRYETDVHRIVRKVRGRQGSVELAYDVGEIRADGFVLPINELEFELVSGHVAAIFAAARTWMQRHDDGPGACGYLRRMPGSGYP